jgi:hypothetical protein
MYKEKEGITLRKDRIVYNEVLRQLAKLQLNTIWVNLYKFKKKIYLTYNFLL